MANEVRPVLGSEYTCERFILFFSAAAYNSEYLVLSFVLVDAKNETMEIVNNYGN